MNSTVLIFARACLRIKVQGQALQPWFDAACGAANNGSNVAARATALKAKMDDDGSTLTQAEVEQIVKSFDEMLYWAATFAPTETLKVSGPLTL
jgi:hypothetical protein